MASVSGIRAPWLAPTLRPQRWLPLLDSYILKEMAGPFTFGLAAFLLFWFINIFFLAADYVINQHAPFFLVLRFLIFRLPQSTPMAFPFACLFGTLLAFGRLTADNEISALRTSGISFSRIVRTPLIFGVLMFALSFWINEQIAPLSTDLSTRTFYQIIYRTATLPIEPQLFRRDSQTQRVFYVGSVLPDGKTMQDIMIFQPEQTSGFREVTTAQTGTIEDAMLVLKDAVQTRFKRNGQVDGVITGRDVHVGLPLGETTQNFFSSASNDPYTMNTKQLSSQIKVMHDTGQGGPALGLLRITLAQKFAYPFASFIAVLIALPLAVRFGRKGRTLGIALSVVVLFVYYALSAISAAFGRNDVINPYLAAWLPNVLMGGAGAYLIVREEH
jgi:lipopolysaccharide export system permease protein